MGCDPFGDWQSGTLETWALTADDDDVEVSKEEDVARLGGLSESAKRALDAGWILTFEADWMTPSTPPSEESSEETTPSSDQAPASSSESEHNIDGGDRV
jgi:hypothetical protein